MSGRPVSEPMKMTIAKKMSIKISILVNLDKVFNPTKKLIIFVIFSVSFNLFIFKNAFITKPSAHSKIRTKQNITYI